MPCRPKPCPPACPFSTRRISPSSTRPATTTRCSAARHHYRTLLVVTHCPHRSGSGPGTSLAPRRLPAQALWATVRLRLRSRSWPWHLPVRKGGVRARERGAELRHGDGTHVYSWDMATERRQSAVGSERRDMQQQVTIPDLRRAAISATDHHTAPATRLVTVTLRLRHDGPPRGPDRI